MDTYSEIVRKIITTQQTILGPVAVSIAGGINSLDIHDLNNPVIISDPKVALTELVMQYSSFFGNISITMCKEAAHGVMNRTTEVELPDVLK